MSDELAFIEAQQMVEQDFDVQHHEATCQTVNAMFQLRLTLTEAIQKSSLMAGFLSKKEYAASAT